MTSQQWMREKAFEIARNVKFQPREDVHIFSTEIEQALLEAYEQGVEDALNAPRGYGVELKEATRNAALEEAAKIPHEWVIGPSCTDHSDDPCCHVRLGYTIEERIRSLKSKGEKV